MSATLKPYPEYKDSGVAWIGRVPAHWKLRSFGSLSDPISMRNLTELPLLSVLRERGVILRSALSDEENRNYVPDDLSNYKVVHKGNLVINKMKSWQGSLGISAYDGIVSPAYFVYELQVKDGQFLHRLLRSKPYVALFAQASDGVRIGQWDLSVARLKRIPILIPPDCEQSIIVRFLDHFNRRINRLIRAKRRLIELLNEQKQAIIHRAVTRGLDPDVRLKPSGIDWLGDVPAHWEVASLRRYTISRCDGPFGSGLKSTHYTSKGVRVIRLQNIGISEFRDKDTAYISPKYYATLGNHDVVQGDLLIAGLGDDSIPAGRSCVAPDNVEPAMVKADCFRFRLDTSRVEPQFVAFQLSSTAINASAYLSTGATRQRINLQTTAGREIAVPPLYEQNEIVIRIMNEARPIEIALTKMFREIDLLREYRTRLIADVVTGKLDVRGVELPALDEAEAMDDLDIGADTEAETMDETEEMANADTW